MEIDQGALSLEKKINQYINKLIMILPLIRDIRLIINTEEICSKQHRQ